MKNEVIKAYMKKELAQLYELSPRAFYTLMKPHEEFVGDPSGRYYSPKQVTILFDRLGLPSRFLEDEYVPAPGKAA